MSTPAMHYQVKHAQIGFGHVHHARTRPSVHRFTYGTYFLMLPMRLEQPAALQAAATDWQPNQRGALSFFDRDHGDGRDASQGGAVSWLMELLHSQGILDADGNIWLQTYPRVWGFTFKPVSFWYCYRTAAQGGDLRAVVAEVNNTFGERHCYVLEAPQWGQTVTAEKAFHVSPFCRVTGSYAFCFTYQVTDGSTVVSARIDHHDEQGLLIHTRLSGALQVLDAAAQAQVVLQALSEGREKSVVASTSAAQVREFQLRVRLNFRATTAGVRRHAPCSPARSCAGSWP
jgi:DUF1365 family protein